MTGELPFIPGLRLSALFFEELVAPLLSQHLPDVRYIAARLGPGSDVLGFDTARSMDHGWGPKLDLFLYPDDEPRLTPVVDGLLRTHLPTTIRGYPTNFAPNEDGGWMMPVEGPPINHGVTITTLPAWFRSYLGCDPAAGLNIIDWLVIPQQRLATIRAGEIFHDPAGELTTLRDRLTYYPHDVWLSLMAAQWRRISQEEPFMGRCGDVGDELGSRVIAARLVHDLMLLCFLQERVYAPYSKWFGTAFSRLRCAERLGLVLQAALEADTWRERETHLSRAYTMVAEAHNALAVTQPLSVEVRPFYSRPYLVVDAGRIADALLTMVADERIRELPPIGAVDQWSDSTDVREQPGILARLRAVYN